MLRSFASIAALTMVSRLLGFLRDVLTATILGAGPVADAFFVAFRLPNHFRALFAEGAFNAAFVPTYADLLARRGLERAQQLAGALLTAAVAVQAALLVLAVTFMPLLVRILAPGFADEPAKFVLAVEFGRITFPYLLLISVVVFLGGVLNSHRHFAAMAAAPVLLNACLIAALLLLVPLLPTAGHALAWGVAAAGVAQAACLVFDAWRRGLLPRPRKPRWTPDLRRFLRTLGPATLGAGLTQISLFADTVIASLLPTGAVSYLYYADRLNQLPLAVIGIAIGTVLLPELSRQLGAGETEAARTSQNRAIELSLLLTLPAAVSLVAIGAPLVQVLFGRGAFTPADATATAGVLGAYAVGLPAFVLIRCVLPAFYARADTSTPVLMALPSVALNVALKILLLAPLGTAGLALATSAGAWLNLVLLVWVLGRRGHFALDDRLRRRLPRALLASLALGLFLAMGAILLEPALAQSGLIVPMAALAVLVGSGLVTYGLLVLLTGAVSLAELRAFAAAGRRRQAGVRRRPDEL